MQSAKFKSPPKNEQKAVISEFAKVKKLVKLVLVNIGSHPGEKPSNPKELAEWKENLLKLGRQGEVNVCSQTARATTDKTPHDKFNASNVLKNADIVKQMLQELKLPNDTPDSELQFFTLGGRKLKTGEDAVQFFKRHLN